MNKKVLYAIPIVALSIGLISSLSRPTYDEGWQVGYDEGKTDGEKIGYENGKKVSYNKDYNSVLDGYNEAYQNGYDEGYEMGYNDALWEYDISDDDYYYTDDDYYYYDDDNTDDNYELTVYVSANGSKYHSYPSCSNMKAPIEMTESQAINKGYSACSKCW